MSTNNYIPMRETSTKIGGTTYVVKAFVSLAARETLEQKLERILLRNLCVSDNKIKLSA